LAAGQTGGEQPRRKSQKLPVKKDAGISFQKVEPQMDAAQEPSPISFFKNMLICAYIPLSEFSNGSS
jgi:hypothetical protein